MESERFALLCHYKTEMGLPALLDFTLDIPADDDANWKPEESDLKRRLWTGSHVQCRS